MRPKHLLWILLVTIAVACSDTPDDDPPPTEEGYVLPPDFPDVGPHTYVVVSPES
jgi:hypothetical protein